MPTKSKRVPTGIGVYPYIKFGNGPWQRDLPYLADPQDVTCFVTYSDNIPGWKTLIRNKSVATTTMTGDDIFVENNSLISGLTTRWTSAAHVNKNSIRFVGDAASLCTVPVHPGGLEITTADNQAKAKFVAKALEFQQSLQGLVVLGELRETINLFRHPVKRLLGRCDDLFKGLKKALKGERGGSKAVRKAASEQWLEWSFGVQPLVNDIDGAAKALARQVHYKPPSLVISATGLNEALLTPFRAPPSGEGFYGWVRLNYLVTKSTATTVRYTGCISSTFPGHSGYAGELGLTFRDILPAAWELVPYSFLIDYFTNAGKMISGLSFARSSVMWCQRTIRRETRNELTSMGWDYTSLSLLLERSLFLGTGCVVRRVTVQRTPYFGTFIPSLEFQIPGLGSKKWLNMAALLGQAGDINGRTYRL
jgi:hypothetical protein